MTTVHAVAAAHVPTAGQLTLPDRVYRPDSHTVYLSSAAALKSTQLEIYNTGGGGAGGFVTLGRLDCRMSHVGR